MSQPPDDLSPASPEEDAGEALPLIELEALLARPPSWRKRFIQIGFLLVAFVVVLVTLWGISRPQASSASLHIQPDPSPPTISIISNINYGSLSINGQPQRGSPPLTVKAQGQLPYLITLDAPPFQPRTCEFPQPRSHPLYTFHACNAGQTLSQTEDTQTILEILFTLAALPPEQQQQIIDLISHTITTQQTTTVPAQSVIATGLNQDGASSTRLSSEPLQASAFLMPTTHITRRGLFCLSFTCVGSEAFSPDYAASGQSWEVQTPIALRWRFTSASGQVVSDVTFPTSPSLLTLFLTYHTGTGWQMAPLPASEGSLSEQLSQLVCVTGVQMLTDETRQLGSDGWTVNILHQQGIQGCELQLEQHQVDQGHFVWRFGALLAADARAHSTLPALPVASPAALAAIAG